MKKIYVIVIDEDDTTIIDCAFFDGEKAQEYTVAGNRMARRKGVNSLGVAIDSREWRVETVEILDSES